MKTKAIVATLLIAAAANVEAYFASPYPRKPVSPDEVGHWILVNGNPWPHTAESGPDRAKECCQIRKKGTAQAYQVFPARNYAPARRSEIALTDINAF